MIENKCDTIKQLLFYFARVTPSDTTPSYYTYYLAVGDWILVYSVGYSQFLVLVTSAGKKPQQLIMRTNNCTTNVKLFMLIAEMYFSRLHQLYFYPTCYASLACKINQLWLVWHDIIKSKLNPIKITLLNQYCIQVQILPGGQCYIPIASWSWFLVIWTQLLYPCFAQLLLNFWLG